MRNGRKASAIPANEESDSKFYEFIRKYPMPQDEFIHQGMFAVAQKFENDRRRRLCMAGLDALVLDGGLPWGVCFGYERTANPGFPVKHPTQARAVERAFSLGMNLSAPQTARVLKAEGHLCPDGTVNWTARMVRSIWDCVTYTGRIQYRKTQSVRHVTGRRVSLKTPPGSQIVGYNASLQIVSDEQFGAVNRAAQKQPEALPG
jgi:hypothetical protein